MHQTTFLDVVPVALARRTDPQTSHDAATSVSNQTALRMAILCVLAGRLLSDEQIIVCVSEIMSCTPSGCRGRRAELVRDGYVRDSGRRAKTATGRECVLWELVL